jgi:hypothetical protein
MVGNDGCAIGWKLSTSAGGQPSSFGNIVHVTRPLGLVKSILVNTEVVWTYSA